MLISLKMEREFLNLINTRYAVFCGLLTETKLCGKLPLRIVHLLYMLNVVFHIVNPYFPLEGSIENSIFF